jgi:hypothetical protein
VSATLCLRRRRDLPDRHQARLDRLDAVVGAERVVRIRAFDVVEEVIPRAGHKEAKRHEEPEEGPNHPPSLAGQLSPGEMSAMTKTPPEWRFPVARSSSEP